MEQLDQAEHLRAKVKQSDEHKSPTSLPPRNEIHKHKKKKTTFKMKYPIIRLLALFFVLLPVAILSYKYYMSKEPQKPVHIEDNSPFESVPYEKEDAKGDHTIDKSENEDETPVEMEEDPKIQERDPGQISEPNLNDTDTGTETNPVQEEEKKEDDTTNSNSNEKKESEERYEIKYHKVQANETLYRISMKYYHSRDGEELLKRWNDIRGDNVFEGQILRIPIKIE